MWNSGGGQHRQNHPTLHVSNLRVDQVQSDLVRENGGPDGLAVTRKFCDHWTGSTAVRLGGRTLAFGGAGAALSLRLERMSSLCIASEAGPGTIEQKAEFS